MSNIYYLYKSDKPNKKYLIITPQEKKINFGDNRYFDYTQTKDPFKKKLYINRHRKRENWYDLNTAGFWSRWLLWNKSDLDESIKDIEKKFNISIL